MLPLRGFRVGLIVSSSLLLLLWIAAISVLYSSIILPGCKLPLARWSTFCQSLAAAGPDIYSSAASPYLPPASVAVSTICAAPFLSRLPVCAFALGTRKATSSPALDDQFILYEHLLSGTEVAPTLGQDFREIVLSLDDIAILLKEAPVDNKDIFLAHLSSIREAARESARRLQKYTSKLISSVTLILVASDHTIAASKKVTLDSYWSIQRFKKYMDLPVEEENQLRDAYLHTIATFESLSRELTHLNGETYEAVNLLDGYIEVFMGLIFNEALPSARKEFGEVLGRIWTKLGGNRALLAGARERVGTLQAVGQGTRTMRGFVLDTQFHLEKMQIGVEELRAQAAEPLLTQGPIPGENVVRSLAEGCLRLKKEHAGRPFSYNLEH